MFKYGTVQSKLRQAPQIEITAKSSLRGRAAAAVEAIVDTGAVMTCLPARVIRKLGGDRLGYSYRQVGGALGTGRVKSYFINLKVADCDFPDIEVLALNKEYAIIGRDILNRYKVTLDAPNLKWRITKRR